MRTLQFIPVLALAFMLSFGGVHAQTATGTGTGTGGTGTGSTGTGAGTSVTTPGTPNTGAGGDAAANFAALAVTAALALAGGTYLRRTRAS